MIACSILAAGPSKLVKSSRFACGFLCHVIGRCSDILEQHSSSCYMVQKPKRKSSADEQLL